MTEDEAYAALALSQTDRCDAAKCGAHALVRVVTLSGDLCFCGHHYAEHEVALLSHGVYVHDDRQSYGYNVDTHDDMPEDGRMWLAMGIRSTDMCRWCCQRLVLRRAKAYKGATYASHNYVRCELCDTTHADFRDWLQ